MPRIEMDVECSDCQGTGLYVGMAERDGLAVVCHRCKGSGMAHYIYDYQPFSGRKPKAGVTHVIYQNPGYILDPAHAGARALPYGEWANGARFSASQIEDRERTCPAQHIQNVLHRNAPSEPFGCGYGMFTACKKYPDKAECWRIADAEGLLTIEKRR